MLGLLAQGGDGHTRLHSDLVMKGKDTADVAIAAHSYLTHAHSYLTHAARILETEIPIVILAYLAQ